MGVCARAAVHQLGQAVSVVNTLTDPKYFGWTPCRFCDRVAICQERSKAIQPRQAGRTGESRVRDNAKEGRRKGAVTTKSYDKVGKCGYNAWINIYRVVRPEMLLASPELYQLAR